MGRMVIKVSSFNIIMMVRVLEIRKNRIRRKLYLEIIIITRLRRRY